MKAELRRDPIQGDIVHVYDGIEEADNRLPNWWLATFVGAILFAACYWIAYQVLPIGKNPLDAYVAEQTAALDRAGPVDEAALLALTDDPLMVSAGERLYASHCVACHGEGGEGKIGPNLTDAYWLHGGEAAEIYQTISRGVDGKGMQAWAPSLGAGKVKQLTAFLLSRRDTNRKGRPPQGEKRVPAATPPPEPPPRKTASR